SDASAPDAVDGARTPFCASMSPAPQYCADFDEDVLTAAYEGTFFGEATTFLVEPGGHKALSDAGLSPPGAFAATVDAVPDGGYLVHARIGRPLMLTATTSAHLQFDFRLDPHGSVNSDIASVGVHRGANAEVRAYYVIKLDHAEFSIQGTGEPGVKSLPLPL